MQAEEVQHGHHGSKRAAQALPYYGRDHRLADQLHEVTMDYTEKNASAGVTTCNGHDRHAPKTSAHGNKVKDMP